MNNARSTVRALCLATVLVAGGARASEPELPGATPQSVRAELLASNPELQALGYVAEAQAAREYPAGALPDPMLEIEWRDIDSDSPTLDPSDVAATRYEFSQRFPLWGKRELARAGARAGTRAAEAARRARALELLAEAEQAWARYWFAHEARATLDEIIALGAELGELADARYRAGIVPLQDALRAQAALTMLRRERIALDAFGADAQAALNGALGRAPRAALAPPQPAPEPVVRWSLDHILAQLAQTHPGLLAAAAEVEAARQQRELAWRDRYPDITLSIAPIQTGQRVGAWDFMIGVEIPLQQKSRRAAEREARLMQRAAETRHTALLAELGALAAERYAAWESADAQLRLVSGTLLAQTEAGYRAARASYAQGSVDFDALLQALTEWRAARLERIALTREALSSAAAVHALAGSIEP